MDNKEKYKYNCNHFVLTVIDQVDDTQLYSTYFDGTQAQAIKYFNNLPRVKAYLKAGELYEKYIITMKANALLFGWNC